MCVCVCCVCVLDKLTSCDFTCGVAFLASVTVLSGLCAIFTQCKYFCILLLSFLFDMLVCLFVYTGGWAGNKGTISMIYWWGDGGTIVYLCNAYSEQATNGKKTTHKSINSTCSC